MPSPTGEECSAPLNCSPQSGLPAGWSHRQSSRFFSPRPSSQACSLVSHCTSSSSRTARPDLRRRQWLAFVAMPLACQIAPLPHSLTTGFDTCFFTSTRWPAAARIRGIHQAQNLHRVPRWSSWRVPLLEDRLQRPCITALSPRSLTAFSKRLTWRILR